ncbi:MAG: magnesium transporter [Candidatus Dependentiae bacterium]|nr:magnesium transporter [Candidatus Dependentiae bacterium]
MESKKITDLIVRHINEVIAGQTEQGKSLWESLLEMHPADSAKIITYISDEQLARLFIKFSPEKQLELFEEVHDYVKEKILLFLNDEQKAFILRQTSIDDLTDLFDELSEKDLKKWLNILHKKDQQKVLSLLKFPPDSAGGIMTLDFVTLIEDMTVEKAVFLLQRLRPNIDLHRQIYITDSENKLVGYINLEDLVLKSPLIRLSTILKQVPYFALPQEDQERIARKMVHYHMMTVPVVNEQMYLLGVIPEETLIDIIQQEATEDVQRMSGAPVTTSYFEIPFFYLLYKRSFILGSLLIVGSISSIVIDQYGGFLMLDPVLVIFLAMLVGMGGNTSGQASAIVIQGMSSGDINESNITKFLRRELFIGVMLALLLSTIAFLRVYLTHQNLTGSMVVSASLGLIVLVSVVLGSCFPIILRKFRIDPAFSAGPLLATIMDILGTFIYCYVAYLVLS